MTTAFNSPSSLEAGLRGCCPQCGRGRLFKGFLKLDARCSVCGLDYRFADPADGPAFFVVTGVGLVVTGLWAWWTVALKPPIWAQFALAMPAMVVCCLAALRPVKAWLVAEQHVHKAAEATWDSLGTHGEAPPRYQAGRW